MTRFAVQKSFVQKKEEVTRDWYLVNAEHEVLGRMAVGIAQILMGKNKPSYTPHVDGGDFVVVTNARKVRVTGRKPEQKLYHHHTGYLGGLKSQTLGRMLESKSDEVIRLAVRRMLPKNRLGRKMLKKLKVYAGTEHKNDAQRPKEIRLSGKRLEVIND